MGELGTRPFAWSQVHGAIGAYSKNSFFVAGSERFEATTPGFDQHILVSYFMTLVFG